MRVEKSQATKARVENAMFSYPDIADVAVIGVPDEKWGEAEWFISVRWRKQIRSISRRHEEKRISNHRQRNHKSRPNASEKYY